MAKRATQQARGHANDFGQYTRGRTQADVYGGGAFGPTGLTGERNQAIGQQQQERDSAYNGINEAQMTGGFDAARLNELRGQTNDFTANGGYDPAQVAKITSGYQNFADTGGFTPDQEANFRRRATSGVPAIYDVLGANAERQRSLTGGLGTGGQISQMARQMSQEQSKAATGAEVDLASQERQGKLAGLGGLESIGGSVAAGRRSGLASGIGLESQVASGRNTANNQMSQLFNAQTGQISDQGKQILAQYGLEDAATETQLKVLQSLAGAPGALGNIQQGVGQVGGILSSVGGMGAAF